MAPALHLDWIDYAERLIGGGTVNWGRPAEVSALINKAQALLPSDLVILPLDRIFAALASPAALAAKPRGADPVRVLLGDAAIRAAVADTIAMLSVPALALGLPAPVDLASLAAEIAGVPAPEIDEDLADDAAVYCADFLRGFATTAVGAVVLTETIPRPALHEFNAPIEKIAATYGWNYALRKPGGALWPGIDSIAIAPDGDPESVIATVRALRE